MPDNVRALRGTHPERAEAKTQRKSVRLPPSRPSPPADLVGEALAEWKRIVPALDAKGLLTKIDRGVLASYCRAWAHACKAESELEAGGMVRNDRDGNERKSPWWQVWRESTALAAMLAKELLLTPNTRLRASMPEAEDGKESDGILD